MKVVSEIHDPVTTTDELIPSGETSSYRSNPLGLAEFALSRKDPAYVGRAKEVQKAQKAIEAGQCPLEVLEELKPVMDKIQRHIRSRKRKSRNRKHDLCSKTRRRFCKRAGSILSEGTRRLGKYCERICNQEISFESDQLGYASIYYRGRHENLSFNNGDYIFVPEIRKAVEDKMPRSRLMWLEIHLKEVTLKLGDMTDAEREIILKGCLINYYRG